MPDETPRRAVAIAAPRVPDDLEEVGELVLHSDASYAEIVCSDASAEVDEPVEDVEITRTRLVGGRFTGVTLKGARLTDVVFESCELSGATFERAHLQRVAFVRCRMAAFAAPELEATDVSFVDCRLDEVWLRLSSLVRCSFEGCAMAECDLYGATIAHSRLTHCELAGAELSSAMLDDVALHGSTLERIKGATALRNVVIGSDQLVAFAIAALPGLGASIDDDYLDDPPGPLARQ